MTEFDLKYAQYLQTFNEYAKEYFSTLDGVPDRLKESMEYSFKVGGKRLRPVLLLATAEALAVDVENALPFALALEMIHTYSLIHDDLPAMDNDDFRRGQPSNHKKFGEGNAVLAGDALLNSAYEVCFSECLKGEKQVLASKILCSCAGAEGMIAGQSDDLYYTGSDEPISEDILTKIDLNKTGKLFLAPVLIASILADNKNYIELQEFGKNLGMLLQITDDILDVTGDFATLGKSVGKDELENKFTYVRFYGLDGAKVRADMYATTACNFLDGIDGDTSFLYELVDFVRNRNK